ncbi:FAD-dependent oxidoreductase, partial [Arthrobacter sp. HMWF013]|uniref:FAD-dependent oxidoreductase n=1 Tax=Arthrobacter sp. HMWF013 TaxID=2056849 RepID=UPI000D3FC2C4
MTMRRIVVVGNGIAGLTACDSLRTAGFDGELTVVGAERHQPYSRPALSKALLHTSEGSSDDALQAHELPEPTHEATELLGVSATGLDTEARLVHLDSGGELPYDGLVIASGSRAKRLAPRSQEAADGGPQGSPAQL